MALLGLTVFGGIYPVLFNLHLLRLGNGPEFVGLDVHHRTKASTWMRLALVASVEYNARPRWAADIDGSDLDLQF
jgi:hypothetical protein